MTVRDAFAVERSLDFDDPGLACELFGPGNATLALLAEKSGVDLQSRGSTLTLRAHEDRDLSVVADLLIQVYGLLKAGHPVFQRDIAHAYNILSREPGTPLKEVFLDAAFTVSPRKRIMPKTLTQRAYVRAMRDNDLTFGIGPAGTGKTYLAVAVALSCLLSKEVKRLILTRPAVEAGEKLGFLPGDMVEKINPYLRPLYDALHDMLDFEKVKDMLETGVIEIAPLAFMRGRTLNDAFVILDEAQNTTPEQMKMFLTRMGFGSRMVVTGDVTQIDLPGGGRSGNGAERSGLVQASRILEKVDGARMIHFEESDVIRHPLVGRIVQAYEQNA